MLPDEPAVRPRSNSDLPHLTRLSRIACSLMPCRSVPPPCRRNRRRRNCRSSAPGRAGRRARRPAPARRDRSPRRCCRLATPSASTTAPEVSPPPTTMRRTPPSASRARGRRRNARPCAAISSRPKLLLRARRPTPDRPSNRRSALRRSARATQSAASSTRHRAAHQLGRIERQARMRFRDRPRPARCEAVEQEPHSTTAGPLRDGLSLGLFRQACRRARKFSGRPSAMPEPPVTSLWPASAAPSAIRSLSATASATTSRTPCRRFGRRRRRASAWLRRARCRAATSPTSPLRLQAQPAADVGVGHRRERMLLHAGFD